MSFLAAAIEGARNVCTVCVLMAVVGTIAAFIDVFITKQ